MPDFLMPKLSDTMEEGVVLQWLVADGSDVARGQQIVEIESDKASMMVEAPDAGVLRIVAGEGATLPVGAVIATIGEGGAATPAPPAAAAEPAAADAGQGIPTADDGTHGTIGLEIGVGEAYPVPAEGATAAAPAPAPAAAVPSPADGRARVKASPLARTVAERLGVDLATVTGSGPGGRIVRADVEAAGGGGPSGAPTAPPAAPAPAPTAPPPASPAAAPGQRVPLTRLQRLIARRMVEAKAAPHFALQRDVDATQAIALRARLPEVAPAETRPSLNDMIVRAVALAVAERPDVGAHLDGDDRVMPAGAHVGVAVAVEGGLLVPVVRDAASKGVGRIAAEVRDLAARCRAGTITPPELQGSVITISNLGMFGIDRFQAVLNPPEAAILAVGRAAPRAVVVDGEVVVRDIMSLTLSVDHRVLYGAEAATFLARVAELLEAPHALVL